MKTWAVRNVFCRFLGRAIGALFLAQFCVAGTIYNNFGPNNDYVINREWDTNSTYMATPFIATESGMLDGILTPVFVTASPVTFSLYTDSNGQPGTVLETWNADLPVRSPEFMATISSVLHPQISAGTKYWLVFTQTETSQVAWYQNNQGVLGGIWIGNSPTAMLNVLPASPIPAIKMRALPASCVASGKGATFAKFCIDATGSVDAFETPAGLDRMPSGIETEGYGICDADTLTAYFEYADGGNSGNWTDPVVTQPKGPNTFPMTVTRNTSDGAYTLTQVFRNGEDRSMTIATTLKNNTTVAKTLYLLRFGNFIGNPASTSNLYDVTNTGGSAWVYDRMTGGVMLWGLATATKHLGVVYSTAAAPSPCNFPATILNPALSPSPFPYSGNGALGTVHSLLIKAGKSASVTVGYRAF